MIIVEVKIKKGIKKTKQKVTKLDLMKAPVTPQKSVLKEHTFFKSFI